MGTDVPSGGGGSKRRGMKGSRKSKFETGTVFYNLIGAFRRRVAYKKKDTSGIENALMLVLETLIVAFSMYSAIPMPRIPWTERNMRYALCAFPFVGLAIGGAEWLWVRICLWQGLPDLLRGAGLCLIPILVTGGIHLDGYMDTCDALSSHRDPARRKEILKDPHIGAFAAIRLGTYLLGSWALWASLPDYRGTAFLCAFCLSRCLSALSVLHFPLAEGSGLARSFSEAADKRGSRAFLAVLTLLLVAAMVATGGGAMLPAAFGVFCYYHRMVRKQFEGLSGDLAGWFLQTAELWMLAAMVAAEYIKI